MTSFVNYVAVLACGYFGYLGAVVMAQQCAPPLTFDASNHCVSNTPYKADELDQTVALQTKTVLSHEPDSNRLPPTNKRLGRLQKYHATSWNRYPLIFSRLKELLDVGVKGKPIKLLSYGCSDGSECHTLRMYFPGAIIDGVDIAADLIAKNKANNTDPLIQFYHETAKLSIESYDAVLAMGVLCSESALSQDTHLAYHKYTDAMKVLDSLVRPGGYLVIYNADYPFSEYPRHNHYENMCAEGNFTNLVQSADMKYDHSRAIDRAHSMPPGMCSTSDKFCIESGWGRKLNRAGELVQKDENVAAGGLLSNGCKYPGTFFKKSMSTTQA